jgi:F0F1-type ATP synthase delta subunit
MEISRAKYLAEALIRNNLSRKEFDDFLNGLSDEEALNAYSEILEAYFEKLLEDQNGTDS